MDLNLRGKVYLISGGTAGIGESIAKDLSKEGAIPVIIGRNEISGNRIKQEIKAKGGECYFIKMTLGERDNCKQAIDATIDVYQRIDGIINNAGTNDSVGLESGSPEKFKTSIIKNLTHYYDLVHYALPFLKKTKGNVINISSKTALTGQGGTSGYAASKGAQLALTREWAVELAPYGIRVNAIIPAEVMTPMYKKWLSTFDDPEAALNKISSRVPLGNRMTEGYEIAAMVAFILSDKSNHTTGQWLHVDGGYVHFDRAILTEEK